MATTDYSPNSLGRVVQVIGPVVDVAFDSSELPEINTALEADLEVQAGSDDSDDSDSDDDGDGQVAGTEAQPGGGE